MKIMITAIKDYFTKQEFHPDNFVGLMINDFYLIRKSIQQFVMENSKDIQGRVLDIGCGSKPYKKYFLYGEYIGLDIENEAHSHTNEEIDVYYDGKKIPFEDNSFDSVVCFEVLEHVFEPDEFLKEIRRVLKPKGKLLLTVPFIFNEHEAPNDYGRYTMYGIHHLFAKHQLKILTYQKFVSGLSFLFQLLNLYYILFWYYLFMKGQSNIFFLILAHLLFIVFRPIILCSNLCGMILLKFKSYQSIFFGSGIIAQNNK